MKKLATITLALASLATTAYAGDAGKGAPAPPAKDAKAPAAEKAAPPAEMKPPQELADMAKSMTGSWKCSGQVADMKDPTKTMDAKATVSMKLDLNNWWMVTSLAGSGKFTLKFTSFTTYDSAQKKWVRFGANNMGGNQTVSSPGMKDNKVMWDGEERGPMGMVKVRETEEMGKDGMHASGEVSMDGKTWIKTHDMTCKK